MGRIRLELDVDGKKCWTLFDFGARNSCITAEAAAGLSLLPVKGIRKSALGGREHKSHMSATYQPIWKGIPWKSPRVSWTKLGQTKTAGALTLSG